MKKSRSSIGSSFSCAARGAVRILRQLFRSAVNYSILFLAMAKRKPEKFSAAKAVKANARERVGQPKPSRVVADRPRTGRQVKHKPRLEELLRQEE